MTVYTLVRHSAFTEKGDPTFASGVELRGVRDDRQRQKVLDLGGVIFEDWGNGDEAEYRLSYPPGSVGMVPRVGGTWVKVGRMEVYVPTDDERTRIAGLL